MLKPAFHRFGGRGKAVTVDRGFTLLELLVVLAIIAILAVLTVPALQGTLSGISLKGSSNILFSMLDLARQTASTRNVSVDVRLYQDSSQPVDSNGNHPYRLIAIVISALSSGAAADQFVEVPVALPGDAIIDSNPTFSSLLNTSLLPATPAPTATEATTAPSLVRGKTYIRFIVLPTGALNLSGSDSNGNLIPWSLTLVNQHGKAATVAGAPAANYITLLLDVSTGRARIYQP